MTIPQPPVTLYMENSRAQLAFAPPELVRLLRYDLAYLAQEAFVPSSPDATDGWIRLMDVNGNTAAGLVPKIRRLLDRYGVPYRFHDGRQRPDDDIPLHAGIQLRPYQRQLVDRALALGRGVIDSPPRSGKTLMGAAIVDANPLPTLWIAPTKGIVHQTARALAARLPLGPDGVIELTGGWPKVGSPATRRRSDALHAARVVVTTAATAVKAPRSFYATRQILVIDEFHHCFIGSSLICTETGWRRIDGIVEGDLVWGRTSGGEVVLRRVLRKWRRPPPPRRLRIETTAGTLEVTDEHEVYTPDGKREAASLRAGSAVCVLEVRAGWVHAEGNPQPARAGLYGSDARLSAVQNGGRASSYLSSHPLVLSCGEHGEAVAESGLSREAVGAHDEKESRERSERACSDDAQFQEGNRRWAGGSLRQGGGREGRWADAGRARGVEDSEAPWVRAGACDQDRDSEGGRGDLVSSRLLEPRAQDRGGDRWIVARESPRAGRPEGSMVEVRRVAGASVHEPAGIGDARVAVGSVLSVEHVSNDGEEAVFDLEVADVHNYFAEGVLVSNSASATYQEINHLAEPIFYRYGMTGTHFRSDENTEILMDAVLSEVIGSVSVQQLVDLGFLAPVDFIFVPVAQPKLGPCALDTAYRIGVTKHQRRNEWVAWAARALMDMGKRVIVLVKLIEHGEKLAEMIPGSRFVRGAGEDVTDEDVRASIAAFNAGECPCLVGTSVLGEGIDLPAADALVYAKGGSAAVTVTQDVFRVLTASPGKERAIVIDFADRHHDGLLAQSISRGRIYAAEDAFSVEVLSDPSDLPSRLWLGRQRP